MRIAIVGAAGVLGREIVAALSGDTELRDATIGNDPPLLLGTSHTAGETFQWADDEELAVEAWTPDIVRGLEVALIAAPAAVTTPILARLRELGITTIDCSRASRLESPLFFDEAPKPVRLTGAPVIALPSSESLALARLLTPLLPLKPKSVRVTILKASSGAGQAGVADVAEATGRLLNGQEPETPLLPHRLAFNVVPQSGPFTGSETEAEIELARDLPRLLGQSIGIASTVGWGAWFFGDFLSIDLQFEQPVTPEQARQLLAGRPHLKVLDDPKEAIYPMPSLATGDDSLLVGRIRADPLDRAGLRLVAAQDGARSAAAHAVAALQAVARARTAH